MINLKKIRTLLKKKECGIISVTSVSYILGLERKQALETLVFLEQQGYLQRWGKENYWTVTMRGQVLVHRKFYRSFRPTTIQRHVAELVERAVIVNAAPKFPDYIVHLKITSKYPVTTDCNAIEVAFALNRKNVTADEYELAADILRGERNVAIGNYVEYVFYPHIAIQKFLKSGSRILKLKQFSTDEIRQLEGTVIFDDNRVAG